MAHRGKIKELYRFAVSVLHGGHLDIYMLCLAYIPERRKYPSRRVLRHIYPLHGGYLRHVFSISAIPVELVFGTKSSGRADLCH